MARSNNLRERIYNGQPIFGTFFKSNCPNVAEILGYTGFDFAIIDCEHSTYSYQNVEDIIRACQLAELGSIIRIASPDAWHVHHGLESGATGIQVPSITSVQQAAECAEETVFGPDGSRSPNGAVRAARFGCWKGEPGYVEYTRQNSLCVVQVECVEMAEKIDELCAIPQIDVLFVGPGDLSKSMGKPGKLNDPEVVAYIENIIKKGIAGGKIMGMLVGNADAIKKYYDMGVRYFAYSNDYAMMANAFKQANALFEPYR